MGGTPRLDVLLYCSGGEIGAARRIGIMLQQSTDELGMIVPDRCLSAGTILALAGTEIVAGRAAVFSPVDPLLQGSVDGEEAAGAISAEDIRRFPEMAEAWFGQTPEEAKARALEILAQAISPPTLTAFYRAGLEAAAVCRELLAWRMADGAGELESTVSRLLTGFHSHSFPLCREDLRSFGLPVAGDAGVEQAAWRIAALLRTQVGGGARARPEDDWIDACLATVDSGRLRRAGPSYLMPRWEAGLLGDGATV
jgi:hypothetical protein